MTLTANQAWVLDYLKQKSGSFVSPTEIGRALRNLTGIIDSTRDSKYYSGVASPICKALVEKNLAVRNQKGHYRHAGSAVAIQVQQPVQKSETQLTAKQTIEKQRLEYNEKRGFTRVAVLSDGTELYRSSKITDGAITYFSERGILYCTIWNSLLGTTEELKAVVEDLSQLGIPAVITAAEPTGLKYTEPTFKYDIGQTIFYLKDNLVHSAPVIFRVKVEKGSVISSTNLTSEQQAMFSKFEPNSTVYATCHGEFKEENVYASKSDLVQSLLDAQ